MEKQKKKGDGGEDRRECYDCWRRRYRRDMTAQAQAAVSELPVTFDVWITEKEEKSKELREQLMLLRDEMLELRLLAGDHYMGRYEDNEEKR